ncbi:hypothetical protein BJ508DRAFT_13258 [Ascobolus immersus RN42]|uniref:Interferon-related developmental regulator N-terminal domain-containing protein n=1 Tax=Ascobolus immersus RN42 TaxID=1160509 RepID=A0A3N4ILV3_ASCIM|nr:hypothetical protein BJ508DRAFT_13258 [Ascobolus immersus RN42]
MSMLQRRAFGGPKVQSRKSKLKAEQQAKASSTASSAANSRAGSRVPSAAPSRAGSERGSIPNSRAGSGDEDSGDEDHRDPFASITRRGHFDAEEDRHEDEDLTIEDILQERIEKMLDNKKKGVEDREKDILRFNQTLLAMDAKDDISYQQDEIVEHFLKTIKGARTEKETLLALKGIALTTLTNPNSRAYALTKQTLTQTVKDSLIPSIKSAAITTLGLTAFFGGADETSTTSLIQFFSNIITTDGESVGASDNADVVTSAINSLAFLLTSLDEAEEITQTLMPGLIDQLDSSDSDVQIAAAEAIALLYEKSWHEEMNEYGDGMVIKPSYTVAVNTHELLSKLKEAASGSRRHLNKRDKKAQHQSLLDVLHSVENPGRGPRYSEALDKDNNVYGSRMSVKTRGGGAWKVDTWWCYVRLAFLKGVCGGGWDVFLEKSESFMSALRDE